MIDFNYQAEVKAKLVVHAQFIQIILSSIFKLILITINASLIWFAWAYLLDFFILSIGLAVIYNKKTGPLIKWHWNSNAARALLKDSWPLIFSGLVISIYMKIDQVMIKEMLGSKEIGQYAIAVKISEAWYFIPMTISSSLFPAIISAKNESLLTYKTRLQNLYELLMWIAVSIAITSTFLAPFLITTLLGEVYLPAANVLSIHIWAGIFVFLGVANGKQLLIENLQKISLINRTIGAFLNIIFNMLLIPRYGISGAAVATIISQSYATYWGLLFFARTRKFFWDLTQAIFFWNRFRKILSPS